MSNARGFGFETETAINGKKALRAIKVMSSRQPPISSFHVVDVAPALGTSLVITLRSWRIRMTVSFNLLSRPREQKAGDAIFTASVTHIVACQT